MASDEDDAIETALDADVIAVVGCSSTPGKDAHEIPSYLLEHGYEVVPINPYADEIFGRKVYDSLADIEETVDVVDVFRPSEEVAGIVDEAIDRDDVEVVWTQLGISDDEAAARAREAGKRVVQDRCIKVEHGKRAR
ncbi:CoA-binding protein [Natronoarchaeum mannanilyticum]|uniref:CoA-binding protein n=1 Tax=Natronoarchaeum mannanilyticum TaxID=926360 RepID=A0AAV3TCU1_9EURY